MQHSLADTGDGGAGDDRVLGGLGGVSLLGNDGDDVLRGNDNTDILNGGDGDDTLIGGTGQDCMTGGAGLDSFNFYAVNQPGATTATADRISDFVQGTDRIDLSFIDAKSTGTTANDAFAFIGAAAFSNVAGQLNILIDIPNNATYMQMDINGDGLVDSMIRLTGQLSLNGGDFVL